MLCEQILFNFKSYFTNQNVNKIYNFITIPEKNLAETFILRSHSNGEIALSYTQFIQRLNVTSRVPVLVFDYRHTTSQQVIKREIFKILS